MGIDNLLYRENEDNSTEVPASGIGKLIAPPLDVSLPPQKEEPIYQQPTQPQTPRQEREQIAQSSFEAKREHERKQVQALDAYKTPSPQPNVLAKPQTDLRTYARNWVTENIGKNAKYMQNYGDLSQKAQNEYIIAKTQQIVKATGSDFDATHKALKAEFQKSSYDKTKDKDYTDVGFWQSAWNGVVNLSGTLDKAKVALEEAVPNTGLELLSFGTSVAEKRIDTANSIAKFFGGESARQIPKAQVREAINKSPLTQSLISWANYTEQTMKYINDHNFSKKQVEQRKRAEEYKPQNLGDSVKHNLKNLDVTAIDQAGNLLADMSIIVLGNLATGGGATASTLTGKLGQSFVRYGVPIGGLSTIRSVKDLRPEDELPTAEQQKALSRIFATSALINTIPPVLGGSLESALVSRTMNNPYYLSKNVLARVGQGALVEGAVGAVDAMQTATWVVAQGDKNNPDFTWKNVKDNTATIRDAGVVGGLLGVASGALAGVTPLGGQAGRSAVHARDSGLETDVHPQSNTENPSGSVQQNEQPKGDGSIFGDISDLPQQTQQIIREIESTVRSGDTSPEAVEYIQNLAKGISDSLEANQVNVKGADGEVSPYVQIAKNLQDSNDVIRAITETAKRNNAETTETTETTTSVTESVQTGVPRETSTDITVSQGTQPSGNLTESLAINQTVGDGNGIVGRLDKLSDDIGLILDDKTGNFVIVPREQLTSDTGRTTDTTVYAGNEPTAYQQGEQINYANENYEVLSSTPAYEARSDGVYARVGDVYALRGENGNQYQHIVLGDGSSSSLGTIASYYSPETGGRRFRQTGLDTAFGDLVLARKQQQRLEKTYARAGEDAKRRADEYAREQELGRFTANKAVDTIDFLRAVTPEMFSASESQSLIANAIKTGVEQEVINTLLYINHQRVPRGTGAHTAQISQDITTANNLLLGNADGVRAISEYNPQYIIPVSSAIADVVGDTILAQPQIHARPTSLLLETANIRKDSENRTEVEIEQDIAIDLLLAEKPTRDELALLDTAELEAITGRFTPEKMSSEVARITIEADLVRAKTESYAQVMNRIADEQINSPETSQTYRALIERRRPEIEAVARKLDNRLNELTPEEYGRLQTAKQVANQALLDAMAIQTPNLTDLYVQPQYLLGSDAYNAQVESVLSGQSQLNPHALSVGVVKASLDRDGLMTPIVTSQNNWESFVARDLMARANDAKEVGDALTSLRGQGLTAVQLDSPLGRDIIRAGKILELANVALASEVLSTGSATLQLPIPNSKGVQLPNLQVTPLQASINEALVDAGFVQELQPIDAVYKLQQASELSQQVHSLTERVIDTVRTDLKLDDSKFLNEYQSSFVERVVAYNQLANEILTLNNEQVAIVDSINAMDGVRRVEGSSRVLDDRFYSAKEQNDLARSAIAERFVELNRLLKEIEELRQLDNSLYTVLSDNNFYYPHESIAERATLTPEMERVVRGEYVDYDTAFLDEAVRAFDSGFDTRTLLDFAESHALRNVNDQINSILTSYGQPKVKFNVPRGTPTKKRAIINATDGIVQHKVAVDASERLRSGTVKGRPLNEVLRDYALTDYGLGTKSLDGIETYLASNDGSFLPLSAIDESFFDGNYPKLERILQPNDRGFIPIQQVREAMSYVLRANADYPTNDGLKAQAYLQATNTAYTLTATEAQTQLAFFSDPSFKPNNEVMGRNYNDLGLLVEQGDLKGALNYITSRPNLPSNLAITTKFLEAVADRYLPYFDIDINGSGNFGGQFDYQYNRITFSGGAHKNPHVVVHELSHALTIALFRTDEASLTPKQLQAKQGLVELYEFAKDSDSLTDYSKNGVEEWIAEVFSNQDQADKLHQLRTDSPIARTRLSVVASLRSAFDYFVNRIRDLFGTSMLPKDDPNAIHTGLTDFLSLIHVYSKPTSERSGNYKGSKDFPVLDKDGNPTFDQNGNPKYVENRIAPDAITPAGDYGLGLRGAEVIFIQGAKEKYGNFAYAGAIRQIGDTNRYEAVMWNGLKLQQTVGTIPMLQAQFPVGEYNFNAHVNLSGSLDNAKLASLMQDYEIRLADKTNTPMMAYNQAIASLFFANTRLPSKRLEEALVRFVAKGIEKDRAQVYTTDKVDGIKIKPNITDVSRDMRGMAWRVQLANAINVASSWLVQVPRVSNVLGGIDRIIDDHIAQSPDPKAYGDLGDVSLQNLFSGLYLGDRTGYSQTRNSKLYELDQTITKLVGNDLDKQEFSVWRTYKHAIERDVDNTHNTRVGQSKPDGFSGAYYDGKFGVDASKAIVEKIEKSLTPERIKAFEQADILLRQEQLQVLKTQLDSGLIDQATYHAYQNYKHYTPLLNRVGEGDNYVSPTPSDVQGRQTNPQLGYEALLEYFKNAQAEVDLNNFTHSLVRKLESLLGRGDFSIARTKTELKRDTETGTIRVRKSSDSALDRNNLVFYKNGKPYHLAPNKYTPLGKSLATFIRAVNPPPAKAGNVLWDGVVAIMHSMNVLQALNLVVLSAKFLSKSLLWNTVMPLANTQASFGTNIRESGEISARYYANFVRNLTKLGSITSSTTVLPFEGDPLFNMYQRQGGGIGSNVQGQETFQRSVRNPSAQDILRGNGRISDRIGIDLPPNDKDLVGRIWDYTGDKLTRGINAMSDFANVGDAITRFSIWEAGLQTIGTPEMKLAYKNKDYAQLELLLYENPNIRAQLNAGSKEIIGNFQERSMFSNLNKLFLFFNSAMQGAELLRRMMVTPQGLIALGSLFALGLISASQDPSIEDLGLDGKDKRVREQANSTGLAFRLFGDDYRIPFDYSLIPSFSLGRSAGAYASGKLSLGEASLLWFSTSKDTFLPITPAQTDVPAYNAVSTVLPTQVRGLVAPLAFNTNDFTTNINGRAYDAQGKAYSNADVEAYQSASPFANSWAGNLGISAPKWENFFSQQLGETYKLAGAVTNPTLDSSDKLRFAFRDIAPTEQDIYRYRSDYETMKRRLNKELYEAEKNPNSAYSKYVIEANKFIKSTDARGAKIKADDLSNGQIKGKIGNAKNDQEKAYYINLAKRLRLEQAQFYSDAVTTLQTEEKRAKGEKEDALRQRADQRKAQDYYRNNPSAVVDLLKTVNK